MKLQSIQSLSIALILFSLGQIAFGQDLVPPFDNATLIELATQSSTSVEGREEREQRREDRQNRRKPVDPLPDNPIPDQNEGEGESVSPAEPTIEPVEGREERERRRREREERQREQEEYDRAHPKPEKPNWIIRLLWWSIELFLWPFTWIFTLIKWGGIFVLITILVCMVALGILCGSVCMRIVRWTLDRLIGESKDPSS